jgi:dihydrodipicolinate synthase/N-acetylneuraminate lyase
MVETFLCSAICTPLDEREMLHANGLREHLHDQAAAGINAVLAAGTMGLMQLLTETTYADLVRVTCDSWSGKGEIFVGVGDTSFSRSLERIHIVNEFKVDGILALPPFFFQFSQDELCDYYRALADQSRAPLYLYDLPQRTGTSLEIETVLQLAPHPNIVGIKCSGPIAQTRQLIDALEAQPFRVMVGCPTLVDHLFRVGISQHVDGCYALAPRIASDIARSARDDNWSEAARLTQILCRMLATMHEYGVYPAAQEILRAKGISGSILPRPYRPLSERRLEEFVNEAAIQSILH